MMSTSSTVEAVRFAYSIRNAIPSAGSTTDCSACLEICTPPGDCKVTV